MTIFHSQLLYCCKQRIADGHRINDADAAFVGENESLEIQLKSKSLVPKFIVLLMGKNWYGVPNSHTDGDLPHF